VPDPVNSEALGVVRADDAKLQLVIAEYQVVSELSWAPIRETWFSSRTGASGVVAKARASSGSDSGVAP
jgi:hypothetical protein